MLCGLSVPLLWPLRGAVLNLQLYIVRIHCFNNLHDLPQKKLHAFTALKNNSIFFLMIYTTYREKKLSAFAAKKITRLDDLFVHELHFSPF